MKRALSESICMLLLCKSPKIILILNRLIFLKSEILNQSFPLGDGDSVICSEIMYSLIEAYFLSILFQLKLYQVLCLEVLF